MSKQGFESPQQTLIYRRSEIKLTLAPKENSPLSQPPKVWYWQAEGQIGFDKERIVAIKLAKQSINNNSRVAI